MKKAKRAISLLMCAALLLGLLPTAAMAVFVPGMGVNAHGVNVTSTTNLIVGETDAGWTSYAFDGTSATLTFDTTNQNYHGIMVRSYGDGQDPNAAVWSYQKLPGGEYQISDTSKFYEIEVLDWEPAVYDNEFVVGYEQSNDFTVQLNKETGAETVAAWGDTMTFTKDTMLSFTASAVPYKVLVRTNGAPDATLTPDSKTFTYKPTTDAGFELRVYRSQAEYEFDTIPCNWDTHFIAEYQVRFDGCNPDERCTVSYDVTPSEVRSYDGRTRLVLPKETTPVRLNISPAAGYTYEVRLNGIDVTSAVSNHVYTWTTWSENGNSDIRPEIVFRLAGATGPSEGGKPTIQLAGNPSVSDGTFTYANGTARVMFVRESGEGAYNGSETTIQLDDDVTAVKIILTADEGYQGVLRTGGNKPPVPKPADSGNERTYTFTRSAITDNNSVAFSIEFESTGGSGEGGSGGSTGEGGNDPLPTWYTVSWAGGNVTVENGEVLAERVHVAAHGNEPAKTYTVIASEYNESDTDNVFSLMDTIGKEKEHENDPDALQLYGLGFSKSDLFIAKDLGGVSIDFKFVPKYGYQLKNIYTNENQTESCLNRFTTDDNNISTFTFAVSEVNQNVHFCVYFEAVSDTVEAGGSQSVTGGSITNGQNATDSGNLKLTVSDMSDSSSFGYSLQSGDTATYLDLGLTQVVSKGESSGTWTKPITSFQKPITVSLDIDAEESDSYYVVRKHDATLTRIPAANNGDGTVSFDTNQFSDYMLVQTTDITPTPDNQSSKIDGTPTVDTSYAWADALPAEASSATAVKLAVGDNTGVADDVKTALTTAAGVTPTAKSFYLDISLNATVGSSDQPISELRQPVSVTLPVPAIASSEQYTVVREHTDGGGNKSYEKLDSTFDRATNKLTFQTDKFSVYAVLVSSIPAPIIPSSPGSSSPAYGITVGSAANGSLSVTPKSASRGDTVTITVTPNEGFALDTLTVTDAGGNKIKLTDKGSGKYTFTMPASRITVKAEFREELQKPAGATFESFTDLDSGAWYHEAVDYVLEHGMMGGCGDGVFGPDHTLSRAMLAQILYANEGRPAVSDGSIFTDVADGAWYTDAVTWANANGIVGGYGGNKFGPNDPITREQLAVMLWSYAGKPKSSQSLAQFSDADRISGYALEAMKWANEHGIITGCGDGILGPQGNATRAQAAQMLKNFMESDRT